MAALTSDETVQPDADSPWGYRRSDDVDARFRHAAEVLRARDAAGGELRADLVLEGGGVKGIALLGAALALSEAGYRFQRVAGSSAGAVVGAFIAAAEHAKQPLWCLRPHLEALHIEHLAHVGRLQARLEEAGGVARILTDVEVLTHRSGLHSTALIFRWLRDTLADSFGVRTFGDLRIDDDPSTSLPAARRYRLVVHVSDVTRGSLVRLPWDYHFYGLDPDAQEVAEAVRASMSIPLFFEPVVVRARPTTVATTRLDGSTMTQRYEGGSVTWVDGALLQHFPIHAFDRTDGRQPRWPTIGVRLSREAAVFPETAACRSAVDIALSCMHTAINEWDHYGVDRWTAVRTIHVDSAGLAATEFDLSDAKRQELFLNGARAGIQFVIDAASAGGLLARA